jgi:hypothetical protein
MKSASGLWTKELKSGGSVTNKILTLKSEFRDLHSKWKTLSLYERFEQTVVSVLTLVIAIIITLAAWQLLLHTLRLVETHAVNPADSQEFQGLFGMGAHGADRSRIQAHAAGRQASSPRCRPGTRRSVDRSARTGSQVHHPRSLSDHSECGRSPGRSRPGARNCILARRQLRTPVGGRCVAGVTIAIPGGQRQGSTA